VAAVDDLAHVVRNEQGLDVDFGRLAPPLENALFRIIQEAVNNACRHSRSQKIRVKMVQRCERVCAEIRDWGAGFDPAKVAEGRLGLRGIRQRAHLLDGLATIESSPGKGTRIAVELPIVECDPAQHRAIAAVANSDCPTVCLDSSLA
jgi:signal transduction histidine kinase